LTVPLPAGEGRSRLFSFYDWSAQHDTCKVKEE
jgi:hypothetical protein